MVKYMWVYLCDDWNDGPIPIEVTDDLSCKYCGFNPRDGSLHIEGAPCGYKGCTIFTCCYDAWKEHMEEYHKEDKKWKR